MDKLDKLLATAEKAALAAGQIMQDHFGKPHAVTVKGFRDLVTDADIEAQKLVTSIIQADFPDHGFLTEEKDSTLPANGPVIWIIDPIDGTTNFSRNLPVFCISIAAVEYKKPITENNVLVGVIFDPMRNEMFSSSANGLNYLNQIKMTTSQITAINDAQIGHDWNRDAQLRRLTLQSLRTLTKQAESIHTFGSAALALAWVAAGRLDGYFNYSLHPWDIAAASLMIRAAGGKISTISGNVMDFSKKDQIDCLASNGYLHQPLLAVVNKDWQS